MGLSWTKKHVAAMADTLDAEYETLDGAANAALDTALGIIEERGKWAVVGQVCETPEHGKIPPDHEAAVKVCLGLFESDTKANEAAAALSHGAQGDRLRTWVVPTFFGTPAAWHSERRNYYAALEAKADERRREKLRASIEKFQRQAEERAERVREMERKADQPWPCWGARIRAGDCRHDPKCK
jgi:hypothetical protein